MKRISISEEEFQAVIEEIALDMKLSSGAGVFLILAANSFGRMVACKLFDGRFKTVSEDANMGEQERETEIQKMIEESLREALEDLGM